MRFEKFDVMKSRKRISEGDERKMGYLRMR